MLASRSTKNLLVRGSSAMLMAQLLIMLAQFVYSGATARIFKPQVFGDFALAISAQTLVSVIATTGLVSYVLSQKEVTASTLRRVHARGWQSGLLGSLLFVALSYFVGLTTGANGLWSFIPLTAAGVLLNPPAYSRLAFVRRQKRNVLDALIFVAATVGGLSTSLILVIVTRSPVALAVSGLVTNLLIYLFSIASRIEILDDVPNPADSLTFAFQVSFQNFIFYLLYQVPLWVMFSRWGSGEAGLYSRATLLTQVPALAFANALNRPLQPVWADTRGQETEFGNVRRVARLVQIFSCITFSCVFVCNGPLVTIWLGADWSAVTRHISLMALFAMVYVPYSVITSSFEMKGLLNHVRRSQSAMALSITFFTVLSVYIGDVDILILGLGVSQFVALGYVACVISMSNGRFYFGSLTSVLLQPLFSAFAAIQITEIVALNFHFSGFPVHLQLASALATLAFCSTFIYEPRSIAYLFKKWREVRKGNFER